MVDQELGRGALFRVKEQGSRSIILVMDDRLSAALTCLCLADIGLGCPPPQLLIKI